ncbi:MAG: hypothetical protein L6Q29_01975 [Candidatus Pacebacteria bacterium]|nr:hypothetical protein [Candidatus Paceibacterota bacterium]
MAHYGKRHGIISYLFWTGVAVFSGVFLFYSATKGVRYAYESFSRMFEPLVYEAQNFPLKVSAAAGAPKIFYALNDGGKGISGDSGPDNYYAIDKNMPKPQLSAKAYLVADLDSGAIILEKNKYSVFPIASITKLMTALVSLEEMDQTGVAAVPMAISSIPYYKVGGLKAGQLIKTGDLIYPLLLESSNVAAETIAGDYGRDKFIRMMNKKSAELGLEKTSFADPSGVSPANVSSAQEVFEFLSYIYKYKKEILEVTRQEGYSSNSNAWINKNLISDMRNYLGGKTGHTSQAKETIAAAFYMPVSFGGGRNIGIALLKSESREEDVMEILDYISKNVRFGANY